MDIPDDATRVFQDGATIIGETQDGAQYTSSSLDTVIQDLSADVNGAVAIQSGTYPWTGMATLADNTHILGDGEVIIDIQSLGNTPVCDLLDVTEYVTIQDLIFQSDGTTDDCISRRDSEIPRKDHLAVRGCEFHDFTGENSGARDVHVINADNWYNSVIENCLFTGVGHSAIRLHAGGENLICRGNAINLPADAQHAIMTDAHHSIIEGNHITLGTSFGDSSYGVRIQDQWADFSKDITIDNNIIEAAAGSSDSTGVHCVTDLVETLDITGNTFQELDTGVSGQLSAETTIASNEFNNCRVGVASSDRSDINFSNNVFSEAE